MRSAAFFTLLSVVLSLSAGATAQLQAAAAYAPTYTSCPSGLSLVREVGSEAASQTLSTDEAAYVASRQKDVLPGAWATYLSSVVSASSVKLPDYVSLILNNTCGMEAFPKLGIATSGGGHRAAIVGAGILNALDARNQTSVSAGTGGLLQAATYLAGLSGGSWLVGSLSQADFPTIHDLVFGSDTTSGWQLQLDLLSPTGNTTLDSAYLVGVITELVSKYGEGFPVTLADVWARLLSRHFVQGTTADDILNFELTHGAGVTFSSIADLSSFTSHNQPFPIILGNTITSQDNSSEYIFPIQGFVPLENLIYEFTPYEVGSWDPVLGAFTPTKYLGSPNDTVCLTGYDQVSFVEGISSDLFIEYNTSSDALAASSVEPIIVALETFMPESGIRLDTAALPNPFKGVSSDVFPDADQELLQLVDGGMDGEVTPYQPLLVKARGVDTIFAIDAVADNSENWATGLSLMATQERIKTFYADNYDFPTVPTTSDEFVSQGLTTRPTFFGCDIPANTSSAPLVIYVANGGAPLNEVAVTNTSTSQTQYPLSQVAAMLDQAFDIATQGMTNGTSEKDSEWAACLACAVTDRSRRDLGIARSGVCASCMSRYCYN